MQIQSSLKTAPGHNKFIWLEPAIQSKTSSWAAVKFNIDLVTSMSSKPEPTKLLRHTGQRIVLSCFDRCQLTITWMSNIKDVRGGLNSWSIAALQRDNNFVLVGRMRPRSMPLAMLTIQKAFHGFLFLCMHVVLFLYLWCSASSRQSSAINDSDRDRHHHTGIDVGVVLIVFHYVFHVVYFKYGKLYLFGT